MAEKKSTAPRAVVPPSAAVEVGVAQKDISPPQGIYARNWGAAEHDTAEGVHRSLLAVVVAIRPLTGGEPLILASIDAGWWQNPEDEREIRRAILEAADLDETRVMLACTHTHAGPSLCRDDEDKRGGNHIARYRQRVRVLLGDATAEALANLEPAVITWATGRCNLAANRDLPEPGGERYVCGLNPDAPADDTLLVGRITNRAGKPLAILVNYACHPTTLAWQNQQISPDFVGAMREMIKAINPDTPCMYLLGAAGDLAPVEQYTGDVAIVDRNGRWLGISVLAALESMLPPATCLQFDRVVESGAPLAVWKRAPFEPPTDVDAVKIDVTLPLKPWPSVAQIEEELAACKDRATAERLQRKLRVRRQVGDGDHCVMPAWIWRIGQAIFVGHPNEAYSAFQIALRKAFDDYAVTVMNIVNGHVGYLAPAELHKQDIYAVWQSPFGPGALQALTDACIDAIGKLTSP